MEKNVGTIDVVIRHILAIVFAYLGYVYHWGFYIITAMLLITATMKFCIPYKLLGINTNKK
jgi:hypothetical protein